jgi:hypothetical protein
VRQVVAELERAALDRLSTEEALSRAAVAAGGDRAEELRLLRTWTRYYAGALRAAADIEVGGSSAGTTASIEAAVRRVESRGAAGGAAAVAASRQEPRISAERATCSGTPRLKRRLQPRVGADARESPLYRDGASRQGRKAVSRRGMQRKPKELNGTLHRACCRTWRCS